MNFLGIKSIFSFVLILSYLLTTSCYEGWDRQRMVPGETPSPIPTPTPPTPPYSYILLETFRLNLEALNDGTCSSNTGLATYKDNEWAERIAALNSQLSPLADVYVNVGHSLAIDDCLTLAEFATASVASEPWGLQRGPEQNLNDRPLLHLKAVFWNEEPPQSPPISVAREDWAAWEQLVLDGQDAVSGTYFIFFNPNNGYFTQWQNALSQATQSEGRAIEVVDPSPAGTANRKSIIEEDTTNVVSWVLNLK